MTKQTKKQTLTTWDNIENLIFRIVFILSAVLTLGTTWFIYVLIKFAVAEGVTYADKQKNTEEQ